MFRLLLALLLIATPAWSAQWRAGTGESTLRGASNASDIDTNVFNSIVTPLDNLLATYCNQTLTYSSASQLTVSSGSVMVSNSDGSVRLMLRNSSPTTVDFTNIDTGAEASSTTYYVYAIAASTSSTSATYKISASSSAPSGSTYYYQVGYFLNDGSSNITDIHNNYGYSETGTWASKSFTTVYQALTDGTVIGNCTNTGSSSTSISILTDSSSSPATTRCTNMITSNQGGTLSCTVPVKRGDYYQVTQANGCTASQSVYFIPTGR